MLVPKLAGTIGSTLRPSLDQIPERRLCTRRRRSSNSGVPSPADQAVFAHVMDEGRHIAVAVAFRVFDLPANLGEQFAVPRHGERREVPFWVAGHAGRTEITFVMAGRAGHARCAVPVRTTHDQRLMRTHSVRLRRTIARRMAIHATRVLKYLTGFLKQRDRTRALVLDRLEARNRAELCAFLASAASDGITGKLISAVWDPWEKFPEHRADLDNTDIYTLRRIVPGDRGQDWGRKQP